MGKKRRVWWIVASLVVAVALFAGLAYQFSDDSRADARTERAVDHIIEEYGFELFAVVLRPNGVEHVFTRAPLGVEEEAEVVAHLRAIGSAVPYERLTFNYELAAGSNGEHFLVLHTFSPAGARRYVRIEFTANNRGLDDYGPEHVAHITEVKQHVPNLWERIKGLW